MLCRRGCLCARSAGPSSPALSEGDADGGSALHRTPLHRLLGRQVHLVSPMCCPSCLDVLLCVDRFWFIGHSVLYICSMIFFGSAAVDSVIAPPPPNVSDDDVRTFSIAKVMRMLCTCLFLSVPVFNCLSVCVLVVCLLRRAQCGRHRYRCAHPSPIALIALLARTCCCCFLCCSIFLPALLLLLLVFIDSVALCVGGSEGRCVFVHRPEPAVCW